MTVIAVLIVIAGLFILLSTLTAAHKICFLSRELGWKVLYALIIGFSVSYSVFVAYLISSLTIDWVDLGVSGILFFGSVFVLLVIQLSLRSLKREKERTEYEKKLAEQDSLTGLPNRASCLCQISEWLDKHTPFALLLIDLNNFKEINDALGHSVGDKLLKELAIRLSQALLPNNVLYRIGGDEFVLLCSAHDATTIYSQNNTFVSTLHHPFHIEGYELNVNYSAGASQYNGAKSSSMDLLKEADIAMYHAKHTRQSLVIFSEELGGEAKKELMTLQMLQHALAKDELLIHYQPVYDFVSGDIVAVEALLRWPQKDGTLLAAEQFIKMALRAGILRQITPWVLNRVHLDLPALLEVKPNIKVHINLSAFDLQSNKIVHHLAEHQSAEGTFSRHIVLEIADSLLILHPESEELVRTLNELGYEVNIDDFATGNGGLRHLISKGLSGIKMDPVVFSHLSDDDKNTLLELCASIAKRLDVKLVAKGIEREEQIEKLKKIGISQMQGFHICEPMSLNNCVTWLSSQSVVSQLLRTTK
ncbi:putative bifunctional diguanylate cyclase/phosphodiesterase [Pseudoalteromonas xiamenensis]